MNRIQSSSIAINPAEIKTNISKFGDGFQHQSVEKDWVHGVIVSPEKGDGFVPVFLAQNKETNSTYFFYNEKDLSLTKFKAGKIINFDDIQSLSRTKINKDMENFILIHANTPKEMKEDIIKKVDEIKKDVSEDAKILNSMSIMADDEKPTRTELGDVFAFFYKHGVDPEMELASAAKRFDLHIGDIHKITQAATRKQPAAKPAQKGRLDDKTYEDFVKNRTLTSNNEIGKFWRNLRYNKNNPMHKKIARYLGKGRSMMLAGDSGIGKTYNPKEIASMNGVYCKTINLEKNTDGAELIGKPDLRSNMFTGQQEMYYNEGQLIEAMKMGAEAAKKNEGIVLILDEIFRMDDMTPFISNFTITADNEYALQYDKTTNLAKLKTLNEGSVWMEVVDNIDSDFQKYSIDGNGNITIEEGASFLLYGGTPGNAAERTFRRDLMTITTEDFKDIARANRKNIEKTHQCKSKLYLPERGISLVCTTNVGEGYEVNMGMDNALFSRIAFVSTVAPEVSFMVNTALENLKGSIFWNEGDKEKVRSILNSFFSGMDKKIKTDVQVDAGQKVSFRMIANTIKGISPTEPLKDADYNVFEVLKEVATEFAPIEAELSAEEIEDHVIVHHALNTIKLIQNGERVKTRKGNSASQPTNDTPEDSPSVAPSRKR